MNKLLNSVNLFGIARRLNAGMSTTSILRVDFLEIILGKDSVDVAVCADIEISHSFEVQFMHFIGIFYDCFVKQGQIEHKLALKKNNEQDNAVAYLVSKAGLAK
jgi:hypothetical protein